MAGHMEKKIIQLDDGWKELQVGIAKLEGLLEGNEEVQGQFKAGEYMALYTTVYNMCTQKPPHDYSQQLYERYKDSCDKYIIDKVVPALLDKQKQGGEEMLKELVKRWENHKLIIRWYLRTFNYIDRYYITRHNLQTLKDVGMTCFFNAVYQKVVQAEVKGANPVPEIRVKDIIKDAVLVLIDKDREGDIINKPLIKSVQGFFVEMGLGGGNSMEAYESDLEKPLLANTARFYAQRSAQWIQEDTCPEYMLKVDQCLDKEKQRVAAYLHATSEQKLLKEVENALLQAHQMTLLEKEHTGCMALLRDDKKDDLKRMFELFSRIPKGLDPIAAFFKQHITERGNALVKAAEEAMANKGAGGSRKADGEGSSAEQTFMRDVIQLHDDYLAYVMNQFGKHTQFHRALKEAFESFCNKTVSGSTFAELLASFCDNLLKKCSAEKLTDDAVEETLDKVVKLLAYISDKDLFAEFYRKRLARRLLFDRSANDDAEKSILTKLKQQCGSTFTSKLEGMVTDMALAKDFQQKFAQWAEERRPKVEISVNVLTTGFWPTYKFVELTLPREMVEGVELFKEFYELQAKHRKLTWIYALGTVQLAAKFDPKPMELILSPFQAAVLLLYNEAKTLTWGEIKAAITLPDEDVTRALHSLACAKYMILNKSPEGKNISQSDSFSVNWSFTDKMRRIKVPLPPVDEKKKVMEDVDKDRKYTIDAAIVRWMKSRKVVQHQQLVMEVSNQLKHFQPDFKVIKKRIEDLIAREFLERDKDNPNTYRYLA